MIEGLPEEEAVRYAIQSFGNEKELNQKIESAIFPVYKVVRYCWNVIFVTAYLAAVAYFAMEFYHPEFDNSLPLSSLPIFILIIVLITGAAEASYEAVNDQYKSKWLANPWIFFMVPSLLIGGLTSLLWLEDPDKYQDGYWLDLYVVPIGAFGYLLSRQLFTFIFVRNKKEYTGKRVK